MFHVVGLYLQRFIAPSARYTNLWHTRILLRAFYYARLLRAFFYARVFTRAFITRVYNFFFLLSYYL